jgi:hypothetical protein
MMRTNLKISKARKQIAKNNNDGSKRYIRNMCRFVMWSHVLHQHNTNTWLHLVISFSQIITGIGMWVMCLGLCPCIIVVELSFQNTSNQRNEFFSLLCILSTCIVHATNQFGLSALTHSCGRLQTSHQDRPIKIGRFLFKDSF